MVQTRVVDLPALVGRSAEKRAQEPLGACGAERWRLAPPGGKPPDGGEVGVVSGVQRGPRQAVRPDLLRW